jgi:hypothetical protein
MNPHGRPWGSEEARAAAMKRWASIRHRYTPAEAVVNARKAGQVRGRQISAQARQRAVQAALAILRAQGPQGFAEALHVVYARAYAAGCHMTRQRRRLRLPA